MKLLSTSAPDVFARPSEPPRCAPSRRATSSREYRSTKAARSDSSQWRSNCPVLLAAGRSNQDIARELVVALDTVKKHVSHILGKLGGSNRTEAVTRARQLDLIS
jgi:DNA-binding NarL/FixJ family response regulator